MALGSCVWASGKDGTEKISRCIAAQKGNTSGIVAGSLGLKINVLKKDGSLAPGKNTIMKMDQLQEKN